MLKIQKIKYLRYIFAFIFCVGISTSLSYFGDLILKRLIVVNSSNSYLFNLRTKDYLLASLLICFIMLVIYTLMQYLLKIRILLLKVFLSCTSMAISIMIVSISTFGFLWNSFLIKNLICYIIASISFPIFIELQKKWLPIKK